MADDFQLIIKQMEKERKDKIAADKKAEARLRHNLAPYANKHRGKGNHTFRQENQPMEIKSRRLFVAQKLLKQRK